MLIRLETNHKCSMCKVLNNTELVRNKKGDIRRCLSCGHEAIIVRKTYTEASSPYWTSLELKDPIEF